MIRDLPDSLLWFRLGLELEPPDLNSADSPPGEGRSRLDRSLVEIVEQVDVLDTQPACRPGISAIRDRLSPGFTPTAASGSIGALLVAIGGTFGGPPFDLRTTGSWVFGSTPDSKPAQVLGAAALYAGMVICGLAWLQLIRLARSDRAPSLRQLSCVFLIWALPFLVAPPLFSRDAYSYAADGQMAAKGISPFEYGPVALAEPNYVQKVSPMWLTTPTPYGPLFVATAEADVDMTAHRELPAIELMRLEALAGVVLAGWAIVELARRAGFRPELAVTLGVLNPLMLFDLVSPAHNDALMAGLLLAGVAAARRGRMITGVVLCALAAEIKVPAAIGVIYIGWHWDGFPVSFARRIVRTTGALVLAAGVMGAVSVSSRLGWSWISNLGTPGIVHSLLTPTTAAAQFLYQLVGLGSVGSHSVLLSIIRVLGLLGAAAACGWWLWRSQPDRMEWSLGLSLLAIVALGPTLQPWYATWGVMMLAAVPGRRAQRLIVVVSAYLLVATVPDYEQLLSSLYLVGPFLGIGVAALCAFAPTRLGDAAVNGIRNAVDARLPRVLADTEPYRG